MKHRDASSLSSHGKQKAPHKTNPEAAWQDGTQRAPNKALNEPKAQKRSGQPKNHAKHWEALLEDDSTTWDLEPEPSPDEG